MMLYRESINLSFGSKITRQCLLQVKFFNDMEHHMYPHKRRIANQNYNSLHLRVAKLQKKVKNGKKKKKNMYIQSCILMRNLAMRIQNMDIAALVSTDIRYKI